MSQSPASCWPRQPNSSSSNDNCRTQVWGALHCVKPALHLSATSWKEAQTALNEGKRSMITHGRKGAKADLYSWQLRQCTSSLSSMIGPTTQHCLNSKSCHHWLSTGTHHRMGVSYSFIIIKHHPTIHVCLVLITT